MDIQKRELWDRLENEPERAYRAFECFLSLPSDHRTIVEAYRVYVGNSEALKPSDTWTKWSRDYAWRERAAAYDDHLASVRREAHEQVIKEEAARQAREIEKTRYRYNELMTLGYVQAAEWLEGAQRSDLRAQDVLKIIGLHLDAVKAFGVEESRAEDDWTEEDEAEAERILREIDATSESEHDWGDTEESENGQD